MISLVDQIQLLRGLASGEVAYAPPFFASLDLTRRCNLHCRYCRFHSSLSGFPSPLETSLTDMPYEMMMNICGELKKNRVREIIFAGEGEPFLYPYLVEAVSAARAAGMHVNVVTNGTLLSGETVAKLVDLKLNLLTVSVWASSEEEYQTLYPGTRPEYFQKVLDGLRLVTEIKKKKDSKFPALRLHRPLSPDNFESVERAVEQARSCGCNQVSVTPIHPLKTDTASCILSPEQETALFLSLARMKKKLAEHSIGHNIDTALLLYRVGREMWKTMACYIGWIYSRIRIDGTVFPCSRCDLPLGNLNETSLEEIRNNQAYRSFRREASTQEGLARMQRDCLCAYCCHIRNNIKVHRIFRWVRPFLRTP